MTLGNRLTAVLLASAAGTGLQAQDTPKPVAPRPSLPTQTPPAQAKAAPVAPEPAKDAAPSKMEFSGPDGEPLPPELQKELEERFKNDPTLAAKKRPSPVANADASPGDGKRDILVTGRRPRGSVIGDIPPELAFNPLDIRAYGATDIGDLLQTLGPQVSSNRGREDGNPVVLLNGKRVSGFAEVAKIPTEAIERMEIFPEELALKYGYRADQKVVNVIVFERFNSQIGQLSYAQPTEGGRETAGAVANYLRIRGETRLNVDAEYNRSRSLLESERGVLQDPTTPGQGRFRTLLPEAERVALNGTVSGDVLNGVSSTLNGRFEENRSKSLLGLGENGPLRRDANSRASHLGTLLGGQVGKWLWSFTGNYDRTSTHTLTDTSAAQGARDEARSLNSLADAELVLGGSVLKLPAGPVLTSLRGGIEIRDFSSRSLNTGVAQRTALSRDRGSILANLDVPIAGRHKNGATWVGTLSANANLEVERLSDLGTLRTFGYGLNWSPTGAINVIASATNEQGAPTVEQLGAPLVVTPNVRTFDFVRSEVVDITQVFGGNAGLRSDDRHLIRFGMNVQPFAKTNFVISVDYVKTRINNPIAPFPIATSEIEAAFPDRFTRDRDGRLLQIDSRPINFQRSDQQQVRWGLNFTKSLGVLPPGMANNGARFVGSGTDLQKALPPGARVITPEAGSPAARRFESLSSRLFFSFYHTWRLTDKILVRQGIPVLDLLNGSAIDSLGGKPRHELEFQAGIFRRGLGARVTAKWQSGTSVRGLLGGTNASATNLSFSDYTTVNMNLFANLADRLGGSKAPKWLKGARVSIGIDNLFNSRPQVRDETGSTPFSYQPAYLDPLGRLVSVSFRKSF